LQLIKKIIKYNKFLQVAPKLPVAAV